MQKKDFGELSLLWKPSATCGNRLHLFRKKIQQKYKVTIANFWDLHIWTVENVPEFWKEVWHDSGIIYSQTFDQVVDMSVSMGDRPEWFRGARLNFAENILRFRDDHPALILTGEERQAETLTYAQMYEEASLYGAAFRKLGLQKGDRVVCYMSNRKEPVLAAIGTTSVGAIWTGALPLLGAKAALHRFKQVGPKILFTIDRFQHDGKEFEMLSKVEEITKDLPTLEKVVIVPSNENSRKKDISKIRNSCFLDSFLALGREEDGTVAPMVFEQLPLSHPVFISYTSGTTGPPKAVVHGAGCLLSMCRDFELHLNGSRNSITLSMSPVGWATWNAALMSHFNGVTNVLFEGVAYFRTPTYLWDLVDELQINSFVVTPSILDDLERREYVPTEKHHLRSLRAIVCGASVVKKKNYDFVLNKVKKGILFMNIYGSTEFMGSCLTIDHTLSVYKGELTAPCYAVDVDCYDEDGKSVLNQLGELVVKTPVPSLPLGLWGDEDGSLFRNVYFSRFPDVFCPGDLCIMNGITGGTIIYGRSDDTINAKGTKYSSWEIYNVVDLFPEIVDSLCLSQYSKEDEGERAVLFVKMKEGHDFDERLANRIREAIEEELDDEHVPDVILETAEIPYNMNGKKTEIVVKKIINGMPYNPETVINPECLKNFYNIPELSGY